jgi:hypothetical protein
MILVCVLDLHVNCTLLVSEFNLVSLPNINFMKIYLGVLVLLHLERQTDGQIDSATLTNAYFLLLFGQSPPPPK